jgi:hypothetical protein
MAEAGSRATGDKRVKAIVAAALTAERKRTAKLILDVVERRRATNGNWDPIVTSLAILADEIIDPSQ